MALLGELHDKRLSTTLNQAYWKVLLPYDDAICGKAFAWAVTKCKWFPKPAELVEFILKTLPTQTGKTSWFIAMEMVGGWTDYDPKPLVHPDPIAQVILRGLGGWEKLAHCPADELQWMQKRFEDAYEEIAANEDRLRLLQGKPSKEVGELIDKNVKSLDDGN